MSGERRPRGPGSLAGVRPEGETRDFYNAGNRSLQDRFDTRRLADRIEERKVTDTIDADDRAFIESMDMLFIATADEHGRPTCSYKGGAPGFVRVLDERTIAFPLYDGNGMFLSAGNAMVNSEVGLLFISFERGRRLRLNGTASVSECRPRGPDSLAGVRPEGETRDADDELASVWPGAQLVVRVRAREVFPNCPRYIHRYELVERSRYVPVAGIEPPVPDWKTRSWARDVLPASDQASRASVSAPSISPKSRNAMSP
jgi:predicted pyridoxine 5'-phosphate oxidase superfamily flavin-nucleotide-binding protein